MAFILAALIQPVLADLQQDRRIDFEVVLISTIFLLAGVVRCAAAQAVAGRLED